MGQIYNGQIKKGLILYFIGILVTVIMLILKIPHTLLGLIILVAFGVLFFLFIIVDAIINAQEQKEYLLKKYNRWYIYLIGVLVIVFIISTAFEYLVFDVIGTARAFKIPSGSMEPTINFGDHLIVDMSFYKSNKPQRGDILLYMPPYDKNVNYIHRCVAIEGDDVDIKNGFLYINREKMNEEYIKGKTRYFPSKTEIIGTVPKNNLVILGDNRENAHDSRIYGYLSVNNVLGRPLFIYYSSDLSRIGKYLK